MAGRLKNDLLRWNLEQRQNNPNYIGSPDHEKAMRDYYARLYQKYSQGLGEVGRGEFTTKTQNMVNQLIGNDVKWAYQQKIKQGEDSARQIAESMNQTAAVYGANGDIQGFKESACAPSCLRPKIPKRPLFWCTVITARAIWISAACSIFMLSAASAC